MSHPTPRRAHHLRRCSVWLVLCLVLVSSFALPLPPVPVVTAQTPAPPLPFGMVAALANRVRADERDVAIQLLQEAGVQWQREEILWDRVQQESGGPFVWDGDGSGFYEYDQAIGAQVAAGIKVLGLLTYNPAWFKSKNPPPEAWIDDWYAYVYATVRRYGAERDWITHWELWNEPNVREAGYESGLYEIKDFVRLLAVGHAAARAADPNARIIMAGMSGQTDTDKQFSYDWLEYMEQVGALGGWEYVDILALHPYHPAPPEGYVTRFGRSVTLLDELDTLQAMMQRYGTKPVWITEFGYTTSSIAPGVAEIDQALFLLRSYLLMLAHPTVETVFWYDFRNDTLPSAPYEQPVYDSRNYEFHYGLLRRAFPLDPLQPDLRKPAFIAYRTMTQILTGLELEQVLLDGTAHGAYMHRYRGDTRRVDVLWRVGDTVPVVQVGCECQSARVLHWDGSLRERIVAVDGAVQVRPWDLGAPLYVVYE